MFNTATCVDMLNYLGDVFNTATCVFTLFLAELASIRVTPFSWLIQLIFINIFRKNSETNIVDISPFIRFIPRSGTHLVLLNNYYIISIKHSAFLQHFLLT